MYAYALHALDEHVQGSLPHPLSLKAAPPEAVPGLYRRQASIPDPRGKSPGFKRRQACIEDRPQMEYIRYVFIDASF